MSSQGTGRKYDHLFKIIIIGDSGVGKTCMLSRFVGEHVNKSHISTIGIDFKMKELNLDGKDIKIQVWDTAGQERYETITTQYYRRAQGIVLVYDITRRISFDNVRKWLGYVDQFADPGVQRIIVGNKIDLESEREVSPEEGETVAKTFGVPWLETSAYSYVNIDEAFLEITKRIYELLPKEDKKENGLPSGLMLDSKETKKTTCSC